MAELIKYYYKTFKEFVVKYYEPLIAVFVLMIAVFVGFYHRIYIKGIEGFYLPQKMFFSSFLYILLPFVAMVFLRKTPYDFGIRVGEFHLWWKDLVVFYIFMMMVAGVFAFNNDRFLSFYPLFKPARSSLVKFLIWELVHLFYMFGWEFLFRGYLLFTFKRFVDEKIAVIIQTIPFVLLHMGKPELEAIGSFFAGIALGVITLRSKSIFPAVLLHFFVALTMDIVAIFHATI